MLCLRRSFVCPHQKCLLRPAVGAGHTRSLTSATGNNGNINRHTSSQQEQIKSYFRKNQTNTKELNIFLTGELSRFHITDVAQLMYSAALSNHSLDKTQLEQIISILQSYSKENHSKIFQKQVFSPVHFSRLMYGLKVYNPSNSSNSDLVCQLFTTLSDMLVLKRAQTYHNDRLYDSSGGSLQSNRGIFNARNFSMCVYGLQNFRSDHRLIRSSFVELIQKYREIALHLHDLCPLSLSYIIYGTQNFDKSHPDVLELLAIVTSKAVHMKPELFTYQLVCNNISAVLKHKDTTSREIRSMWNILTTKFQQSNDHNRQHLNSNLMGIFFFRLLDLHPHAQQPPEVLQFISTLTDKVEESPHVPSPIQVSNMLYSTKHLANDRPEVRRLHKVVIDKAHQVEGKFSPRDLSKCVSSLQHINMNYYELQPLIPILSKWFAQGLLNRRKLNTKDLEACLYGLRHVKCTSDDARQLIHLFSEKMKSSNAEIDQATVVHGFHLLRSADCAHPEIQAFIEALLDKIHASNIRITKRQKNVIYGLSYIQNPYPALRPVVSTLVDILAPMNEHSLRTGFGFLGGLRRLRCEYPETRQLLSKVISELQKSPIRLHQMNDIGYSLRQSFYVFHNMSSQHKEVREYLNFLADEIDCLLAENPQAVAALDACVITDCLYCLRGMRCDYEEVQHAVFQLTQCALKCKNNCKNVDVARALYGLQHMTHDSADVRTLVALLTSKLTSSPESMTLHEVGMALMGLQGMSPECSEVAACLQALLLQASRLSISEIGDEDRVGGNVDLVQVLKRFQGMRHGDDDDLDAVSDGLL